MRICIVVVVGNTCGVFYFILLLVRVFFLCFFCPSPKTTFIRLSEKYFMARGGVELSLLSPQPCFHSLSSRQQRAIYRGDRQIYN